MLHPFFFFIDLVLGFYGFVVFAYIILQLLTHFQIINGYQPFVKKIMSMMADIVEPALKFIRRYMKPLNNIDLSPVVLIFAIELLRYLILYYGR